MRLPLGHKYSCAIKPGTPHEEMQEHHALCNAGWNYTKEANWGSVQQSQAKQRSERSCINTILQHHPVFISAHAAHQVPGDRGRKCVTF